MIGMPVWKITINNKKNIFGDKTMKIGEILTELKKIGYMNDYERKQIILAKDGYVFIFDDENKDDIDQILLDRYEIDIEGIIEDSEDGYLNFIRGMIQNNKLYIYEMTERDVTSVFAASIKKLIKEFELDGLVYEADRYSDSGESIEHEISRDEVLNATFKTFEMFHGTNSKYIMGILSKGLIPTKHTNFDKIFHKDKIFFTSKKNYSAFHALNSANKNDAIPIIVKFKVPDETKIVLDFDVAIQLYGIDHPLTQKLGYDLIFQDALGGRKYYGKYDKSDMEEWKKLADKASLNSRTGIFGYTGRIPPTHITGLYVDPDTIRLIAEYIEFGEYDKYEYQEPLVGDMVFMTVDKFKKLLEQEIEDIRSELEED
jgi:hypothetical protein